MMRNTCETEQEYFLQQRVHQKLQGGLDGEAARCKSTLLVDLVAELTQISSEIIVTLPGESLCTSQYYRELIMYTM